MIPQECKTESYQLVLKTTETLSNAKNEKQYTVSVNGLTASVNLYTLKENYFENETITGKSEITAGGSIENTTLKAQIIRYVQSQGMSVETPGEFLSYNLIEKAVLNGNILYLRTNKGIISYDKETGIISTLYSFADNIAFNSLAMMVSSTNELWIATAGKGVFRRDGAGQWINYPTNEVGIYLLRDIIEMNTANGTEIWTGGNNGISFFDKAKGNIFWDLQR